MRFRNGWVEITKAEYDETPDELKGHVTYDYSPNKTSYSYVYDRTLYVNRRMYVEHLNMYIME